MRLVSLAVLAALTTLAMTGEADARGRRHHRHHVHRHHHVHHHRPVRGVKANGAVRAIVSLEAARAGVPLRIAHAVIKTESGYNCRARNRSGAAGAGQLMPRTARALGVRNIYDCHQNIAASMRYLRAALNRGGAGCAGVSLYETGVGARPHCSAYGRRVMRTASL